MKKSSEPDKMRSEYKPEDLGAGVRGKYYAAYKESRKLVLLTPEVAEAFPTEKAVNETLLSLIKIARASTGLDTEPGRDGKLGGIKDRSS